MSVPGTVRSGGEITFWGSLGQKHVMLFIVSQEPVHLLILKKIPACWNCVGFFFLLQITAKVKKKKKCNRTSKQQRSWIYLQTDVSPPEKLQPFSQVCLKTLVLLFLLLHALWFVYEATLSGTGNRMISLSSSGENIQIIFFSNRNLFKLTKIFLMKIFSVWSSMQS